MIECESSLPPDMTMEEVREYERTTQEATNLKIGTFPPTISISETTLASCTRSGPNSAPSTPLSTEAPDFLSVPKDRPRKKSAPETLTLPDPGRRDSLFKLPSFFSWNSSPQPEWDQDCTTLKTPSTCQSVPVRHNVPSASTSEGDLPLSWSSLNLSWCYSEASRSQTAFRGAAGQLRPKSKRPFMSQSKGSWSY